MIYFVDNLNLIADPIVLDDPDHPLNPGAHGAPGRYGALVQWWQANALNAHLVPGAANSHFILNGNLTVVSIPHFCEPAPHYGYNTLQTFNELTHLLAWIGPAPGSLVLLHGYPAVRSLPNNGGNNPFLGNAIAYDAGHGYANHEALAVQLCGHMLVVLNAIAPADLTVANATLGTFLTYNAPEPFH